MPISPELLGTIAVGLIAATGAVYTAGQGRRSADKTTEVQAKENERDAQIELLKVLSEEVDKANARIIDLRARLAATEDLADAERTKRREMQAQLDQTILQVQHLQAIMKAIPTTDPEVLRVLDALLRRGRGDAG